MMICLVRPHYYRMNQCELVLKDIFLNGMVLEISSNLSLMRICFTFGGINSHSLKNRGAEPLCSRDGEDPAARDTGVSI